MNPVPTISARPDVVHPPARGVAVGSLRSHWRTLAMLVSTFVMAVVLAAGPVLLGFWAARSWRRSGFLFIDLVFACAVLSSVAGWTRVLRPGATVKRIVVLPVVVQRAGRWVTERSAFGVGAMTQWTSVEPDFGLTLVQAPRGAAETEWEDSCFARRMSVGDAPLAAAGTTTPVLHSTAPKPVGFDAVDVHVTSRGESFWSLAEAKLGDPKRWTELRDLNIGREVATGIVLSDTDGLNAGYRILVPTTERGANPA